MAPTCRARGASWRQCPQPQGRRRQQTSFHRGLSVFDVLNAITRAKQKLALGDIKAVPPGYGITVGCPSDKLNYIGTVDAGFIRVRVGVDFRPIRAPTSRRMSSPLSISKSKATAIASPSLRRLWSKSNCGVPLPSRQTTSASMTAECFSRAASLTMRG
jgi:hypothetical protein